MSSYEAFAELERRGWTDDGMSSGYVEMFSSVTDFAIPSIVAAVMPGARVLDLCCGHGNVSEALIEAGYPVVGADFSAKMLAHARRRVPDGEFVEADAQNLPFDEDDFDTVVCSFGIMHIPDQPRALREVRRVLKRGGQFIMTSWCGPGISPVFRLLYTSVQEHGDPSVALPESPDFHQYAEGETARSLLSETGLIVQTQQEVDCFWLLDEPEGLAEIFQRATPRGGYLLAQQTDATRTAIKAAVTRELRERFADGSKWRVPMPASMIVATAA